jgi:hypothetical protein
MANTPNSSETTPRAGEVSYPSRSSSPASPAAPAPSPRPSNVPSLSQTKAIPCYACGDPSIARIDDDDGAGGKWACRDCQFISPASCEHCDEARAAGKAAVCECERVGKPRRKMMRLYVETPKTPGVGMKDVDEE